MDMKHVQQVELFSGSTRIRIKDRYRPDQQMLSSKAVT